MIVHSTGRRQVGDCLIASCGRRVEQLDRGLRLGRAVNLTGADFHCLCPSLSRAPPAQHRRRGDPPATILPFSTCKYPSLICDLILPNIGFPLTLTRVGLLSSCNHVPPGNDLLTIRNSAYTAVVRSVLPSPPHPNSVDI
ncbi:hypothetical protein J6590_069257 [Homalodisca vitripennis]|nr:hypothetical protein J6590_069257 [Homalodisca vitripennis]